MTSFVQAFPTLVKTDNATVWDGAKVTVRFYITLRDDPTTTYNDTEQFVQGQHVIPPAIEQQMAWMQSGEAKTFPLSAEKGFGSYDETRIQPIPTAVLPLEAREGNIVILNDDASRTARIVRIFPETTVLDLNHPLAGQPLLVTLQIVTIENPDEVTGDGDRPDLVMVGPETVHTLATNTLNSHPSGDGSNFSSVSNVQQLFSLAHGQGESSYGVDSKLLQHVQS